MGRFLIVAIASAAVATTGCGDDDGSGDAPGGRTDPPQAQSPTSATTQDGLGSKPGSGKLKRSPVPKSRAAAKLIGRREEAFRQARKVCRSYSVAELARRYEARIRNPVEVARAYAIEAYSAPVRPGAFEGCVAGFSKRASTPSAASP
jgi:hypothetical protein